MKIRTIAAGLVAITAAVTSSAMSGCNSGKSDPSPKGVAAANSAGFISGSTLGGGINAVGSFTAVANMSQGARAGHTATVLVTGNVLVVGGQSMPGPGAGLQQEAELYDPTADTWTVVSTLSPTPNQGRLMDPTGQFATGRSYHVAVKLPTGAVMVCGGLGFERLVNNNPVLEALESTYTFDPATNAFATVGTMVTRRYFHLGHLAQNNTIIVACGWDQFDAQPKIALQSADSFDPASGTWTAVTGGANALTAGHTWGNFVQFGQNTMVINGGRFDNAASQQPPPTLITINGITPQAVMIGSPNSTGRFSAGGEVYSANQGAFTAGPSSIRANPPNGIILTAGHRLASTNVSIFAGGEDLAPSLDTRFSNLFTTEILDLPTGLFVAGPDLNSSAPTPQGQPAPAPIAITQLEAREIGTSADVLIMGGIALIGGMPTVTDQAEIFDTLNIVMKNILQMQTARFDFQAVKLTGNGILVIGGRTDLMNTPTDSVEFYTR
jgi:hypothetical protein